ncbi:hypothetical protein BB561_005708 [Smittium simulii]|uniref:RNA helicase n=1 Tax=Smittium simulii TaxID=133385 RepID=A0A2T9Y8W1_9FUNG|nr:hypothetical protein BB561_005708 [Smittium simulii]
MHVGPTNSGKTYNALKRLEAAKTGIYCSPLRLLAHEIYSRMNNNNRPCELITGEDRRTSPFDFNSPDYPTNNMNEKQLPIISSTIEMANLSKFFEVAVIDEIQMMQDPQRGWAWTTALLGINAAEVHLCGEETTVPLVKKLLEFTGDEIQVIKYERLNKLIVSDKSVSKDYTDIKKGDCIICFSRKEIFNVAAKIEKKTKFKCAVIYGSLPPENRSLQADLFNDPNSDYKVLVASDAIGMGLNLRINRVIFQNVAKFDGTKENNLTISQIKQIGGRAGRYSLTNDEGEVTAFNRDHLSVIAKSMPTTPEPIKKAGIFFDKNVIERFSYQFPENRISEVITAFSDCAVYSNLFFMCNSSGISLVAEEISKYPLTVKQFLLLLNAPISYRNPVALNIALKFVDHISQGKECNISNCIDINANLSNTKAGLQYSEALHRSVLLYLWLSYHYPTIFCDIEAVNEYKLKLESAIQKGLLNHASFV